jgi:hypothetical protein
MVITLNKIVITNICTLTVRVDYWDRFHDYTIPNFAGPLTFEWIGRFLNIDWHDVKSAWVQNPNSVYMSHIRIA